MKLSDWEKPTKRCPEPRATATLDGTRLNSRSNCSHTHQKKTKKKNIHTQAHIRRRDVED